MTGRAVPEWVGKHPDVKVPSHVRQRVYERYNGTCHLSGIQIAGKPWELEHIKSLHLGGEHRETNLAPALADHHRIKTAAEMKAKAKADRAAKKASGSKVAPKQLIRSAPFPASGRRHAHPIPALAPRPLFVDQGDA